MRWKSEDLENAILEELKTMVIPETKVRTAFRRTLEVSLGDTVECQRQQYRQTKRRLSEIANMKDRLLNAYLMGTVDEITLRNKTAELDAEMRTLENAPQMTALGMGVDPGEIGDAAEHGLRLHQGVRENDRVNDPVKYVLSVFDMSQNIEEVWQGSRWDKKRRILDIVSSHRYVSDVSLCIQKRKPFDVLAKQTSFVESRGDRI